VFWKGVFFVPPRKNVIHITIQRVMINSTMGSCEICIQTNLVSGILYIVHYSSCTCGMGVLQYLCYRQ